MTDLSYPQRLFLHRGTRPKDERTIAALQRKGLIESDLPSGPMRQALRHLTKEGRATVDAMLVREREGWSERVPDGTRFVTDDLALEEMLREEGVSIYVYRGSLPLVVRDGNGQRPLAIVDPKLFRDIALGEAGNYLHRRSILGHKGSYGFDHRSPEPRAEVEEDAPSP